MNFYIRKRILKTFERFKFKANNPDSHIYGYIKNIKHYKTDHYQVYELNQFKFTVYNDNKIIFSYEHQPQAILNSFCRTTIISRKEIIHHMLDECDSLTNNNTK